MYPVFGILVGMSLLIAAPLWAEPSASVKYLMQEHVSMLDWGLEKIEENLYRNREVLTQNEGNLFEPEPVIRVAYTWEENRIQIFVALNMGENVKKTPQRMAATRSHVVFVVAYLRGRLTMMPYDAFFRHKGFRSKESPENLNSELVKITDIHITVRDHQGNILSRCKALLSGNEIVWSNIGGS
ncbi:MAG: hypothetical protein JRD49_00250 [Deltaproteobacteria bacterium]|nr:hypothetical protein [Deltaproteobacteria bacterium]MBW2613352.1 hypothetical protein [Deltaproteobacteria bacterium]MBW2675970.1 hypothetical protein [Deltaproteobacteria bacterium]